MSDELELRASIPVDGIALGAEPVLETDGSIWSHAAPLATFKYGDRTITLDRPTVENFLRVFATGYPRKVPVDWDHGITNDRDKQERPAARPKAGTVVEMHGVFTEEDVAKVPGIKRAVERHRSLVAAGKTRAVDPSGLWIRWHPVERAMGFIKSGEYTEHSITFHPDLENPFTGTKQGPAIIAVALTNLPHLDNMLPVAATRTASQSPTEPSPMEARLLNQLSVMTGRAIANEAEAVTELSRFQTELGRLNAERPFVSLGKKVSKVLGFSDETADEDKVVQRVTELTRAVEASAASAAAAKRAEIEAKADGILTTLEKKLTPTSKGHFRSSLIAELTAGTEPGKTTTETVIKSLPDGPAGAGASGSGGDALPEGKTYDERLSKLALTLRSTEADLVEMSKKDPAAALKEAVLRAGKKLGPNPTLVSTGGADEGEGNEE